MGHTRQKVTARQVLFGQLLVGLGQFTGAHPQILDGHLIVLAQPAADLLDHRQGNAAGMFKHAVEAILVQFQNHNIAFCDHGGGARRVMDESHLAEEIPRTQGLEQAHFVLVDEFGHLHIALQDHIEGGFVGIFAA